MPLHVDVAIIGASTAGLYAAAQLARSGWRVGVFEQRRELSHPHRTLIITPRLEHLLGPIPPSIVLHTTRIMTVTTPGAQVEIELQAPDLIVERRALIDYLAEQAQEAGATLWYGARFRSIQPHPAGAALLIGHDKQQSSEVTAGAVIGADGAFSSVATAAGMRHSPVVPILQTKVRLPAGWNPQQTQVWFDTTATNFFFWLIPESEDMGVVGLVGNHRADIHRLLQRLLHQHNLQSLGYQAAHVPLYAPSLRPWSRVGTAPVLLVGDAAGQVKVTTVGGTVSGLWGAKAAVESLLHNTPYSRALGPLTYELVLHWLVRQALDQMDNAGYDYLVENLSPAVQQCLRRWTRDELATFFWQVLLFKPRLALMGVQLLLRHSSRRWSSAATIGKTGVP